MPLNEVVLAVSRRQIGKHPTAVFTYLGEPVANVCTKAWKTGATVERDAHIAPEQLQGAAARLGR